MNRDRILKNSLDIIRKYLDEDAMTLSSGSIAGTPEYKGPPESKLPPVYQNPKKKKRK